MAAAATASSRSSPATEAGPGRAAPAHAPPWRGRLGIALVLALATALRLWRLGARSVWTDEGSTWTAATQPLAGLIHHCIARDASPPLYYLLTALALRFGHDEAHLRAISVVASVALVWLTYRIARLALPRDRATFAALLTALSPYQVMYAQEARSYALAAALAVASTWLFARAVLWERPRAWRTWVLVTVAALYTQTLAVLMVGVQAVLVAVTRIGRRHARAWALGLVAVVALFVPWLAITARQTVHLSASHWYLTAPGERGVFQVLRSVFLAPIPLVTPPPEARLPGLEAWLPRPIAHALLSALVVVPLALALLRLGRPGPAGMLVRLAAAATFLPLLVVLAVSFAVPLWLARYFVFLTPFIAVLLAIGLARLPRGMRVAWAGLLALMYAYGTVRYQTDYTKEPWRDVTAHIAARAPVGRTAVLVPFDLDPFAFYDARLPHPVAGYEISHPDVPFADRYSRQQLDQAEAAARAHAAGWDEVWVIVRSPNSPVRRELARRAQEVAAAGRVQLGPEEVWRSTAGPLRVTRYARAGR